MVEELRNAEERERLQRSTHNSIIQAFQTKLERERSDADHCRLKNEHLISELTECQSKLADALQTIKDLKEHRHSNHEIGILSEPLEPRSEGTIGLLSSEIKSGQ